MAEDINIKKSKSFNSEYHNLVLLETYRNSVAHCYDDSLTPAIFSIVAKAATNYASFLGKYFSRDVMADEGLTILPLGFKLPFRPQDFLSSKAVADIASQEGKDFLKSIVNTISALNEDGVSDSVVLGFDVCLKGVKKENNADILAAITSIDEADGKLAQVKEYRLTDNPGSQAVTVTEEDLISNGMLTYGELVAECKKAIPGFSQNKRFNKIMKDVIKVDELLVRPRYLNPKTKKGTKQDYYSPAAIDKIRNLY